MSIHGRASIEFMWQEWWDAMDEGFVLDHLVEKGVSIDSSPQASKGEGSGRADPKWRTYHAKTNGRIDKGLMLGSNLVIP